MSNVRQDNGIIICRATRRTMSYGLLWPNQNQDLNPGKSYVIKTTLFAIATVITIAIMLLHLIVNRRKYHNWNVQDDIALMVSYTGSSYMASIYVKNQGKIALLLRDLSNFKRFGMPPNFKKQDKFLNLLSNITVVYCVFTVSLYNLVRLYQKPECEKLNIEKHLEENCGILFRIWAPFKIDYFPVYQLVLLYAFTASIFVSRSALMITFQVFEISQHIIQRIRHLNSMIVVCFDDPDYEVCRKKLLKCILYHTDIIELATRFDSHFTSCMFGHFTMTGLVSAALEKQFIEGDRLCAGFHLMGWVFALLLGCVAGQLLTDASESISEAIWNSKWYQADARLKKDVLFLLARSQKNFFITVGPFGILSLDLFVKVLKTSYSILCMLTS
ncbi:hypothetical protein MTP99_002438 [Tenebrio molitor]|nr:hypothetical protein MTP99_002438 [Tenebrio molitor]